MCAASTESRSTFRLGLVIPVFAFAACLAVFPLNTGPAVAAPFYPADPYEVPGDDTKDQARDITLMIAPPGEMPYVEDHTLDTATTTGVADEDWFRFYVTSARLSSGLPYLFEALANTLREVNPVIEVYGPGSSFTPTPGVLLGPSSLDPVAVAGNLAGVHWWEHRGASLAFRPTTTGWYYLRVRPYGDNRGWGYLDGAGPYVFRAKIGSFARASGVNRYATAAAISKERFADGTLQGGNGYPNLSTAIVASGENFPDALAGASLAGVCQAPILLARPNELAHETASELTRLDPDRVFVLGGSGAVSDAVIEQIRSLFPVHDPVAIERIAGPDRIGTALAIAYRALQLASTPDPPWPGTSPPGLIFLCSSLSYADALSAGPMASGRFGPIVLTGPDRLHDDVRELIGSPLVSDVIIVGGTGAISAAVESQVKGVVGTLRVRRLAGADRYETSKVVATWAAGLPYDDTHVGTPNNPGAMGRGAREVFAVCRGDAFPDALAATAICTQTWFTAPRPILLTPSTHTSPWLHEIHEPLPPGKDSYLQELSAVGITRLGRCYLFGGSGAVSDGTFWQLDNES
jgi:hypothetical protein